uniref:THAP domain-containing protein 1 n=1 Tax=Sparus aurata TaxID=8175 RepID=A0A671TQT4_SPAAU
SRVRASALHCCVPLCTVSSRYNKEVSFHAFPVDGAVRAEWMQKIRRDDFNPNKNTRVCSRHFKQTDFSVTVGGLRRLKKGTVPVYFSWNGYELPAPRTSVLERRPRAESPAPESDSDSEMETEMAPDHDYCVVPQTGARANDLADENEALRRQITELQQQQEVLKLRQRFGIERLSASDEICGFLMAVSCWRYILLLKKHSLSLSSLH